MPADSNPTEFEDASPVAGTSTPSQSVSNRSERLRSAENPLLTFMGGIIALLMSAMLVYNFSQIMRLDQRIDRLEHRMDVGFDRVDARFDQIEAEFDARFVQVDARFDRIDAKFDQVDAKFDRIDARLAELDRKLTALIAALNATAQVEAAMDGELIDPG